ncbi:hypothetical protein ASZ90_005230 [hydrocarbon metagenome]|uniref:Uncharacterized protein n=1 Tax=hydrocarbon metagenome TaxID=938273 RepID=A0A0W8FVX9_9ZZZZ
MGDSPKNIIDKITGIKREILELKVESAVPATSMDLEKEKKLKTNTAPIMPPKRNVNKE